MQHGVSEPKTCASTHAPLALGPLGPLRLSRVSFAPWAPVQLALETTRLAPPPQTCRLASAWCTHRFYTSGNGTAYSPWCYGVESGEVQQLLSTPRRHPQACLRPRLGIELSCFPPAQPLHTHASRPPPFLPARAADHTTAVQHQRCRVQACTSTCF